MKRNISGSYTDVDIACVTVALISLWRLFWNDWSQILAVIELQKQVDSSYVRDLTFFLFLFLFFPYIFRNEVPAFQLFYHCYILIILWFLFQNVTRKFDLRNTMTKYDEWTVTKFLLFLHKCTHVRAQINT